MTLADRNRDSDTTSTTDIEIRTPVIEDGPAVWQMIADTPGLDDNSMYCNLLQCGHFAPYCAIATIGSEVVGWVSGYIPPAQPDVYFVWQICVAPKARGRGLARKMIDAVLAREAVCDVKRVQATITGDNKASWALFDAIARDLGAELMYQAHFTRDDHFAGQHDTEFLVTIAPRGEGVLPITEAA